MAKIMSVILCSLMVLIVMSSIAPSKRAMNQKLFGYEDAAKCKEECPKFCEELNGILNSDQFRSACENNICQCCLNHLSGPFGLLH
ncbi:hypothetical protein MKW94_003245 [Papaver nudicaule]|uniref:Uncharacterized protein n=1 Tax=Papaver nudicaule TaxID=74823 RepID=A0AA41VKL9_PAPNU|nr:hypothetical protein [Papaver nudicaule]